MKWSIAIGKNERSLHLPDTLLNDVELPATIAGKSVLLRWHQALQTLYIRSEESPLQRCLRLRSLSICPGDNSGEFLLIAELAGFSRPSLMARVSPSMGLGNTPPRKVGEQLPCIVRSPLTGKVLQLFKSPGQSVQHNEVIAIIEAMKMENRICAPRAGTIHKLSISINAMVQVGAELAIIH
jgi:pyruvate carboxylase